MFDTVLYCISLTVLYRLVFLFKFTWFPESHVLFAIYMVNNRTWLYPLTYFVFKKSVNIDSRSWEKRSIIQIKYNRSNLTSICHFLFPSPLSRDPSFFLIPYFPLPFLGSFPIPLFTCIESSGYFYSTVNIQTQSSKFNEMKTPNSWYFLIDGPKGIDGKRAGYKRYK